MGPRDDLDPDLGETVEVSELHMVCSFPVNEPSIAASDNCRQPAMSVVIDEDSPTLRKLWRCHGHEGKVRAGVTGVSLRELPRPVAESLT